MAQRHKPPKLGSKAPRANAAVKPLGSGPTVPAIPSPKAERTAPAPLKVTPPRGS